MSVTRTAAWRMMKFSLRASRRYCSAAVAASDPSPLQSPAAEGDPSAKTYSPHIVQLVDDISKLTLLECADLNELLKKRLGIQGSPGMMSMMAAPAAAPAEEEEEEEAPAAVKTAFCVKIAKYDTTKKVPLIKEIKTLMPNMNLVQAKKFVESTPAVLGKDLSKDEAEKMKEALEAAGATCIIE